jgi:heavy metal sensor kinase
MSLRTRLTLWYVTVLALLLLIYATLVFAFQYVVLTRQIFHDEVQDAITVEGLLYFDSHGALQLQQNYYSRPQSHLLLDRLMEIRDLSGKTLYRSSTLNGMSLGGPLKRGEGDDSFNERIVRLADGSHALIISHIHTIQGRTMVIRLGYDLAPLRTRMVQFLLMLLVAIPGALIVAGAAGQLIAKRGLRPLEEMTARAEGITASNLHDRLHVENPKDELGQLASVFNHLLQRLEHAFRQMKRFTADAAHELRTPLASIRTVSEVALERGQGPEQYRDALANILEEAARLNETIEGLLLLARAEATQPGREQTVFSAKELVDEVLGVLGVLIEEKHIAVLQDDESAGTSTTRGDRDLVRVAFMNVLHNAVKFSPPDSILQISYSRSAEKLRIAVRDQGPGIAPEEKQRVFDRFYTSTSQAAAAKSGSGLGLSIAKLIIDRIGGTIGFEDSSQGAKCVIELSLFQ